MSLTRYAFLPLVLVALAFGVLLLLGFPGLGIDLTMQAASLVATLGSLAAATTFERGDYLRKAWLLSALSTACLLVRDALSLVDAFTAMAGSAYVLGALLLACNATTVVGSWFMARIFQEAGLASEEVSARWWLFTALALLFALGLTFPSFLLSIDGIRRGDGPSVVWLISALGDVLSLALIGPILLTAVAMRGGLLIWPWALLTTSIAAWLLYDAAGLLEHFGLLSKAQTHAVAEFFSCLACAYTASAGLVQRRIVRS